MVSVQINSIKQEDLDKMDFLEKYFKIKTRTKILLKCLDICYNTFKEAGEFEK